MWLPSECESLPLNLVSLPIKRASLPEKRVTLARKRASLRKKRRSIPHKRAGLPSMCNLLPVSANSCRVCAGRRARGGYRCCVSANCCHTIRGTSAVSRKKQSVSDAVRDALQRAECPLDVNASLLTRVDFTAARRRLDEVLTTFPHMRSIRTSMVAARTARSKTPTPSSRPAR
jgi:hypothetical protein